MEKFFDKNNIKSFLNLKDYSVSGEAFELLYNKEYDLLLTLPQPSESDLDKYYESSEYISHTDSRRSFMDKIYQQVKSFMLKQKLSWIKTEKPHKGKLLDVGAGTGDFLLSAKNDGWEVFGTEPNSKARSLAGEKKIELALDSDNFEPNSFDVISMWHVLEHVKDLEKQIQELKRLLKNDGILIIAVPNFKSFDAQYYKNFWAAYDVPRHLWHFSEFSIKKIFNEFGFDLKQTRPLKFDSFYVSLLSEKYKTGGNFVNAFRIGLQSNLKAKRNGAYSSLAYFLTKS